VQALRKGVKPTRQAVAPVSAIFRALMEGTRKKEVSVRFGVTAQTVSNVRSRVLDLVLYRAVQQFVSGAKVAK
jgi:DNA-binding NarL/FixJ family response regulator